MAVKKKMFVTDCRELILESLKLDERNLMWLHRKTGIPYGTLYYCLVKKHFTISDENLERINIALTTNFENK